MEPVLSSAMCRCCASEGTFKDIHTKYHWMGDEEVYSVMLKECFDITITMDSVIGGAGICGMCITRLRDACNFKRQVQKCQRELQVWLKHQNLAFQDETKSKVKIAVLDDIGTECEGDTVFSAINDKLFKIVEIKDEPGEEEIMSILGLDDLIVKKRTIARKETVKTDDIDKRKFDRKTRLTTESKARLVYSSQNSTIGVSRIKRIMHNVENIIKHSNCTVFSNKTIDGYLCAYCKGSFKNPLDLRAHTHTKHKNDKLRYRNSYESKCSVKVDITDLKCNICSTNLATIKDLKEHLIKKHSIKFFTELNDYFQVFKLTESDTQKCALCHSTYETFKMLLQHMNGHYRNYVCDVCDMGFLNKQRLTNHKKTHDKGAFKCDHCENVYDTRRKKMCHENYIHKNSKGRERRCPQCDGTFKTYYLRNKHMLEEHNTVAADYKCNVCDKSFLVKAKLTSHIQNVHLMERNHKCSECGKGFFMKRLLEAHMVTHGGERIYKCAVCEKAYARRKTLREHMRIHNNDRRFKCGICAMTFVQKCSMKSHMLSNHGVTLAEFESSQC